MIQLFQRIPRNAALLIVLLFMMLVGPLIHSDEAWFLGELTFDLVLLAGVYSAGPGKNRWSFVVLTVATLGLRWGELLSGHPSLDVGAMAITVVWVGYAVSIIIAHLFQRRDVTVDTILGAIVAYLLAAVAFMMLFQILELQSPGSFRGLADNIHQDRTALSDSMMYFSLVCMTTMGYGDIVPVSEAARPLAVIEGVFGQLYLAVMIARLVGLHLARQRD